VRDSEEALIIVPGASSLSLSERVILESEERLFEVVGARPKKESKPILLDLGTGNRRFEVIVREKKKPRFPETRSLSSLKFKQPTATGRTMPSLPAKPSPESARFKIQRS